MTSLPRVPGTPGTTAPAAPAAPAGPAVAVTVNGASRQVSPGLTLDALVATLTTASSGVAVAVNEAVVPRGEWAGTGLAEGDRIEVLTAVQGG